MIKQHYWTVATKQVFQAFTDDNSDRTTNTYVQYVSRPPFFHAGIYYNNQDQANSYRKLDERSCGYIRNKGSQSKNPGIRTGIINPQINGPIEEEKKNQVNDSCYSGSNNRFLKQILHSLYPY
jgi:hypothetical protein